MYRLWTSSVSVALTVKIVLTIYAIGWNLVCFFSSVFNVVVCCYFLPFLFSYLKLVVVFLYDDPFIFEHRSTTMYITTWMIRLTIRYGKTAVYGIAQTSPGIEVEWIVWCGTTSVVRSVGSTTVKWTKSDTLKVLCCVRTVMMCIALAVELL